MVHTYRNSKTWLWFFLELPLGSLICAPFIVAGPVLLISAVILDSQDPPKWFNLLFASFFMLFSVGAAKWIYGALDVSYEFQLADDGWCEFRSLLRRRRLHVSEINSIKHGVLRYRGGRLDLMESDDFADFLARLKGLNPAVAIDV